MNNRIVKTYRLLLMTLPLILISCGGGTQTGEAEESADTIIVVRTQLSSPEALRSVIPSPPEGFQYADEYMVMDTATGDSIANASVKYTHSDGAELFVTVSDYLIAREFFNLAVGLWQPELAFERDGSFSRAIELPETQTGWEAYDIAARQGTMLIGVNGRFLVSLRVENTDNMMVFHNWITSGWLNKLP